MVLEGDEIEVFCQQMTQKLVKHPIEAGETYLGVVTGISKDKKRVWVKIGDRRGYIPFETMRWARTPNPEVDYESWDHCQP